MTENITTDDTSRILSHEEMAGYGWVAHQDIADEDWTFVRYADPQTAAECIDDGDPVLEDLCFQHDPLECYYLEGGQTPWDVLNPAGTDPADQRPVTEDMILIGQPSSDGDQDQTSF